MEEIRLTSWYGKYPTIYKVSYLWGGAGFLPFNRITVFVFVLFQIYTTKGGTC